MARPSCWLALPLAVLALAARAEAQSYTDEQLLQAWSVLDEGARREISEWTRLELSWLDTSERRLIELMARSVDVDPGFWPEPGTAPYFEPGGRRARLDPESEEALALRRRVAPPRPPGDDPAEPWTAWTYDPASRRLVRRADDQAPDFVFHETLGGRAPERSYVVALVERALDDGRLQRTFSALAHAWSEDDGDVHPDLTLYEVLASEEPLPLAEVDARGVVLWVRTDELPVETDRSLLDRQVLDLFDTAHAWRRWLRLLAEAYLDPDPTLDLGVRDPLHLHALWYRAGNDPARLAEILPAPEEIEAFVADWAERFRLEKRRTNAFYRQRDLRAGSAATRQVLGRVFREAGGFEPRGGAEPEPVAAAEPAPEPEPEPEPDVIELGPETVARVLERVGRLSTRARGALLERCVEAALASGAPQVELVRLWTGRAEVREAELGPPTEFDAHDARVFGGGPKRRAVGPGDRLWDRLAPRVTREPEPPRPRSADYEHATGCIVAPGLEADELRPLRLLLDGVLPGEDFARAAVLAALDAPGRVRREAEYFAHLYSDRDGNAYEGITLYDVWSSALELEVPDVDALAYIRKIWNDTSVLPPLSGADHDRWYPRMSASLATLRQHVHVTRALAEIWFTGRPELPHGYDASIDLMHALVANQGENATAVGRRIEEDGREFLNLGLRRISSMGNDGWNAGNERRDRLIEGRVRIRGTTARVLRDEGLLDG